MARGATWSKKANVHTSFSRLGGNSPWTTQLSFEPLEDRRVLSVTLSDTAITASEGLAGEYDTIPRLSGFDTNNSVLATAPSGSNTFTKDFFEAIANGNWSNASHDVWYKNNAPTNDAPGDDDDVVILTGINITYDVTSTTPPEIFSLEIGGKLTFQTDANTKLRVGTLYVLPAVNPAAAATNPDSHPGELVIEPDSTHSAEIIFTDYDWGVGGEGTTGFKLKDSIDTHHFTGGLIAYGIVKINGTKQLSHELGGTHGVIPDTDRGTGEREEIGTWAYLTGSVLATATTATLSKRVDWKIGDTIIFPDTSRTNTTSTVFTEERTITGVSFDSTSGKSIITFAALTYDHKGYTSTVNSGVSFTPVVGLLTHNVKISSESSSDSTTSDLNRARAHTIFGGAAQVHVTFAQFTDLGRTDALQSVFVDTVDYDSNPDNQNGRYAVHFHHVFGPSTATIAANSTNWMNDYSFVFAGNSIVGSKKWALALHDASDGDVRGNVIYGAQGAGIVTEDGSEVRNHTYQNLVTNVKGKAGFLDGLDGIFADTGYNWVERQEKSDVARAGTGIWQRRSGNFVESNVTMDTQYAGYTISSYYLMDSVNLAIRGLDKAISSSNYTVSYENPVGSFVDNTAIGKSERGASFAYISGDNLRADSTTTPTGEYGYATPVFTAENFRAFNVTKAGVWAYHVTNLKFSDLAVVNDVSQWTSDLDHASTGFYPGDGYEIVNVLLEGGILEGNGVGFVNSMGDHSGTEAFLDTTWKYRTKYLNSGSLADSSHLAVSGGTTLRDVVFKNWTNVAIRNSAPRVADHNSVLLDSVDVYPGNFGGSGNPTHAVYDLDDGTYSNVGVARQNIAMNFGSVTDAHMVSPVAVLIKNGITFHPTSGSPPTLTGDHQLYFAEQDDDYEIEQTLNDALLVAGVQKIGQPGAGALTTPLSNFDLWDDYGLAAAGGRLPTLSGYVPTEASADFGFVGTSSVRPFLGALPDWLPLPDDPQRLALVTPWEDAELIVPADYSTTTAVAKMWIRAQVNGGLKRNTSGDVTERVVITVTDTTPGVTNVRRYFKTDADPTILPWHTYHVLVVIEDSGFNVVTSREADVSVVQPHIVSVVLSNDDHEFTVPTGSKAQLGIVPGTFDHIKIRFNQDMVVTGQNLATALTVTRASTDYAEIGTVAADFDWDSGSLTATWKFDASMEYGQYSFSLSQDLVDNTAAHHKLYNGWNNPATYLDAHPGVSAVLNDGTVGSTDFVFTVRVLAGDTNLSGTVDFTDFGTLLNNYNQNVGNEIWRFWLGDLNGDGVVDFADLGILLNNYNKGLS